MCSLRERAWKERGRGLRAETGGALGKAGGKGHAGHFKVMKAEGTSSQRWGARGHPEQVDGVC